MGSRQMGQVWVAAGFELASFLLAFLAFAPPVAVTDLLTDCFTLAMAVFPVFADFTALILACFGSVLTPALALSVFPAPDYQGHWRGAGTGLLH